MSQICVCDQPVKNLGTPKCIKKAGRDYKLVFVNLKDSTGADNFIPSGQAVDQNYIDAKVYNLDASVRWYPSPEVKNFTTTKADAVYQSFDDGTRQRLRDGVRNYTGLFIGADENFLADFEDLRCAKVGFFLITDKGAIRGYDKLGDGNTYPIPVDVLDIVMMPESGDSVQHNMFTIDIPLIVLDRNFSTIYGATGDLVGIEGLFGLDATASNAVSGGYTVTIKGGGAFGNTEPYTGASIADFVAYNVTQLSPTTVATLTESANGVYDLTFTGAVTADVIKVSSSQALLDAGFEFNKVSLAVL